MASHKGVKWKISGITYLKQRKSDQGRKGGRILFWENVVNQRYLQYMFEREEKWPRIIFRENIVNQRHLQYIFEREEKWPRKERRILFWENVVNQRYKPFALSGQEFQQAPLWGCECSQKRRKKGKVWNKYLGQKLKLKLRCPGQFAEYCCEPYWVLLSCIVLRELLW